MKLPDGIEVSPVTIEGVTGIQNRQAEWLIPLGATKDKSSFTGWRWICGSCRDLPYDRQDPKSGMRRII
jgi:hypothetical protein